jgi:Sulfotransferase domain
MTNRSPGNQFPDFFVVGQPKCGTTALYEILRDHPEIFMPGHKEPNYFITDAHYRNTPESLDEYLGLFEPAEPGQRVGEASVLYLASTTAAKGIAEHNPEAKIIAILREPAALLRSFHRQVVESRVEVERDLRAALAAEPLRRQGRKIHRGGADQAPMLFYSAHVHYVEQLRRFSDRFSEDQMLILLYDDFHADNAVVVARILDFLEVDSSRELRPSRANPTVEVRSPRLDQLVHSVSVGRGPVSAAAKRGVVAMTPRKLRRRALGAVEGHVVRREPSPPDEELMAELRARYRPEVEALGEYLDRDLLALWGYEP